MTVPGLYAFDQADEALSLLPMAARRALDVAGLHLSLAAWQTLPFEQRVRIVALGAARVVDTQAVAETLSRAGVPAKPEAVVPEPDATRVAPEVAALLGAARPLTDASWQALTALDRYVLVKLASRGKRERLAVAYDEIVGPRQPP